MTIAPGPDGTVRVVRRGTADQPPYPLRTAVARPVETPEGVCAWCCRRLPRYALQRVPSEAHGTVLLCRYAGACPARWGCY